MKHIDLRLKQKNINGFTAKKKWKKQENTEEFLYTLLKNNGYYDYTTKSKTIQ